MTDTHARQACSEELAGGAELRRQAEARLQEQPADPDALSPDDARRLLHELRVHQIELEMQNEELRRAQAELESSHEMYFDLYDLAPVGYLILSEPGLILEANLTAARLFGVNKSQLIKQPVTQFIVREDQDVYYLLRRKLETGEPQTCELRLAHKDSAQLWAHVRASVTQNSNGAPIYRITLSDITERKQMESELQKRTHDLRERVKELGCLYDISELFAKPGIALEERLQGTVDLVRQGWQYPEIACARITLEERAFRTENWQDSTWKQASDIMVYGERAGVVEVGYLEARPAGDEGPFLKEEHDLLNAIAERLGKVTQRMRAEEALRQSEERLRVALQNVPLTVFNQDRDLRYTWIYNLQVALRPGDIVGKTDTDFVPPEHAVRLTAIKRRALESGIAVREEMSVEVLGETYHYDLTVEPLRDAVGNIVGITGATWDITERKRVEQDRQHALMESQRRQAEVSALLAASRAVLEHREFKDAAQAIYNSCQGLLGATGGYLALLSEDGTHNEPVWLDTGDLPCTVDPSLPMPIRGLREQTYRSGRALYENDFRNSPWVQLLPEGHTGLESVLFAPLAIKGLVVGIIGLANKPGGFDENDVRLATAFGELAAIALVNSRTLEMLENSEERFRSVAQNASDAIISYNSLGNVMLWNDAAEGIFGYPSAEMLGQPFSVIMPPHVQETHEHKMRRALASDKPTIPDRTIETTGLRKDGSPVPIELSLATWQTKEGRFYTSIIRDITERKQSEEALRQAQDELERRIHERTAMEERQRLARELHDSVSQAFYGISLGAHTALTLFDSDRDKVVEALNYVLSLAAAGLTEMRALIFELRPESLEIEGLVTALGKHAAAMRARHGIEVGLELCDEPDLPLEIKEAIYRIALEALQNAVKHARPNRLDVRLNCSAEGITLDVCDNGVGFDPMASFPGHLGLRSMRERAARLGGTLDIESAPGCGTRIRVCIPVRAAQ